MQRRRERTKTALTLPTLDLPRIRPQMTMLGQEDRLRIHRASCEILKNTGIRLYHTGGLKSVARGGGQNRG